MAKDTPLHSTKEVGPAPRVTPLMQRMSAEERSMLAQFEGIVGSHRGERGKRGEEILRAFLRRFLPHRFGVGEGEVLGVDEQFGPQLDAIIFDWTGAVPLDRSPASQVYRWHDVYAGIEVRTELRPSDMAEITDRCRDFNRLSPPDLWLPTRKVMMHQDRVIQQEYHSLPFYGVIAAHGSDINALARAYVDACSTPPHPHERIGFIYVMTQGLIAFTGSNPQLMIGPHHRSHAQELHAMPHAFLHGHSLYVLMNALVSELQSQAIERA